MKEKHTYKQVNKVPEKAVLLIPEPESKNEEVPHGIKPGYYDSKQMLQLIGRKKSDANAIQFIADMLETGNPKHDGFAEILRTIRSNPQAIARVVQVCKDDAKVS